MRIEVLMASGELDGWNDVKDSITENGALHIVRELGEDEVPGGLKTVEVHTSIDQGPDLPPTDKVQTLEIIGTYAPGMWMKAVYLAP